MIADNGVAFSFNLDNAQGSNRSMMNLRDNIYQNDWKPLLGDTVIEGECAKIKNTPEPNPQEYRCGCYCCRRHTRAYIHHLLNTHELLAHVLLNM